MSGTERPPVTLVGLVRIRNHCTFTWRKPEDVEDYSVDVRPNHCPQCLVDVQRLGYRLSARGSDSDRDD